MDLVKLFETQKILRDRINYNEPDRFNKLILALLVELGECANEWRGFKFWSKCQKPTGTILTTEGATDENAAEYVCANDECSERFDPDDENLKDIFGGIKEECPKCEVGYLYVMRYKNALLEEYVDGLHFVLELGIEIDEQGESYFPTHRWKEESILKQFQLVYKYTSFMEEDNYYTELLHSFIHLGYMLDFTWEEVETAYYAKNKINHQRQSEGY